MNAFRLVLMVVLVTTLVACGGEKKEHHDDHGTLELTDVTENTGGYDVSDSFKDALEGALDHYFSLSAALVQSDAETARLHSQAFIAEMGTLSSDDLVDGADSFWAEHSAIMLERAENLSSLQDIEEQRYQFEYLSESMINVVASFGPLSYTVYQQRCPMVRDGSADWLSKENAILNPYHGDRMLRCGGIVREI